MGADTVYASFARQLERELAEALRESEDRNQQWALKSIYASELEQTVSIINSQLTAHKAALEKCGEIIEGVINNQPAIECGSMYYERFDGEGNYSGAEHVDPCGLYLGVMEELHKALSEIAKLKGTK